MGKPILVIDDDWEIRAILQELLEDEGYEVDTASDGLLGWAKLDHQPGRYGVILLDLTLPGMDGLQIIQTLRQQEEVSLHPIIVLSADDRALQRAVEMGIRHALEKPFDLTTLLFLVSTFFYSRKLYKDW
ncbi:MAG TPA: response regulator [Ktedonobacteraceae bacterium]|jgi:DNA-binding response OmpR family regulator|nr:response regulator [Ktedonobacteraceae bacterium]